MTMRLGLAALLLTGCIIGTGCIIEPPDSGGDYPPSGGGSWGGGGSGGGGGGGPSDFGCHSDSECSSGTVCARTGECLAASSVHAVHALWTVGGEPATDASCTDAPKLDITFADDGGIDTFGYSPVPCDAGKYTVDKLPLRYEMVTLSRAGDYYGGATARFDVDGNATLDLPY